VKKSIQPKYEEIRERFGLAEGDHVGIVLAHPDDESYLVGGLLRALHESGVIVHPITATDGEASTVGEAEFVKAGKRRQEAAEAYKRLHVAPRQQHYLGLPDGELYLPHWQLALASNIGGITLKEGISQLFTLGSDGFDNHPDHIATHEASVEAQKLLASAGKEVSVWELKSNQLGEIVVPVNASEKLQLAEAHSQFELWPVALKDVEAMSPGDDTIGGYIFSKDTRERMRPYDSLLEQETYTAIRTSGQPSFGLLHLTA
jgi:LmbE family N-acetylglucosaminyl deacetylase